jgi:hypothetical protein
MQISGEGSTRARFEAAICAAGCRISSDRWLSCRETPPPREEPATRPLCAIVEEVLDWRPSNYFTVSTLLPIPDAPKIMLTHAFQDQTHGATRIEMRVAKPKP